VFLVPVHLEGNSVANGYSGGALHVDGEVTRECKNCWVARVCVVFTRCIPRTPSLGSKCT